MKPNMVFILMLSVFFTNSSWAEFNEYVLKWYERYKLKEQQCQLEAQANIISMKEFTLLKDYKVEDVEAYAVKVGVEHKIECTSKELVQVLHSAWVAHLDSPSDKDINNFDYILDEIVDPRYLDAIIHLGGVSKKTLKNLDQIEYFQKPFDIESRPWE